MAAAATQPVRAVVIGGGSGSPASIRACLASGYETCAVVAMADDGGSSGLLRQSTGIVPPGDVRKCLIAMAAKEHDPWARAMRVRFSYDNDHALGNLMLTALTEVTSSFPEAIRLCGELLGARGQVFPSTLESVQLTGRTTDGRQLSGQARLCAADSALLAVSLEPTRPQAYQPALTALAQAGLIVLGPGSLFTSIIPNLLVPGVLAAIAQARKQGAICVYLANVADMQGETAGFDAAQLVEALLAHGMRGLLDYVVVHARTGNSAQPDSTSTFASVDARQLLSTDEQRAVNRRGIRRVVFNEQLRQQIEAYGARVVCADLVDPLRPTWHEVGALSAVLSQLVAQAAATASQLPAQEA